MTALQTRRAPAVLRWVESAVFAALAIGLHLGAVWLFQTDPAGGAQGGSAGRDSATINAADAGIAALVAEWDTSPEIPDTAAEAPPRNVAPMPDPVDIASPAPAIRPPGPTSAPLPEQGVAGDVPAPKFDTPLPDPVPAISAPSSVAALPLPTPPRRETPPGTALPEPRPDRPDPAEMAQTAAPSPLAPVAPVAPVAPAPKVAPSPPDPAPVTASESAAETPPDPRSAEAPASPAEVAADTPAPLTAPSPRRRPDTVARRTTRPDPAAKPRPAKATQTAAGPRQDAESTTGTAAEQSASAVAAGQGGGAVAAGRSAVDGSAADNSARRDAFEEWARSISARIERKKRVPRSARRSGVVGLVLTIAHDGTLADIRIAKGSGSARLDKAAIAAARRAAPFRAAPDTLRGDRFQFSLNVVFRL